MGYRTYRSSPVDHNPCVTTHQLRISFISFAVKTPLEVMVMVTQMTESLLVIHIMCLEASALHLDLQLDLIPPFHSPSQCSNCNPLRSRVHGRVLGRSKRIT